MTDLATLSQIGAADRGGGAHRARDAFAPLPSGPWAATISTYRIDRTAAARYGITVGDVQEIIQTAIGGMNVTETVEGLERYPVNVRYDRDFRSDLDSLGRVLVPASRRPAYPAVAAGHRSPSPMTRTASRARMPGAPPGSMWTSRASTSAPMSRRPGRRWSEQVKLPVGYNIVWSGQFEYMETARERLTLIIPLTILIIFVIIYINTKSLVKTGIVFLAVPFSLVGAFWYLYLLGYNTSIAVWVGVIALAGLDAETGVVMLLYLDLAHELWQKNGRMLTRGDLKQAIHHGAVKRIRPKIMTISVIIAGLLPIMWSHGAGADVMKRIAAPMVGGVVTSGIMELMVYPVIFYLWRSRRLEKNAAPTSAEEIHET